MPKKFVGENSKASEAKARKAAAKEELNYKLKKQAEDELWKDDDKLVNRKLQRKDEKEKKRIETLEKKEQAKLLLESEMNSIKVQAKVQPPKMTRTQILADIEKKIDAKKKNAAAPVVDETPLVENLNRLSVEEVDARNIDQAIQILGESSKEADSHPEKRAKAAYAAFEEANLPRLKMENPSLRLSQLKQLLFKEWQKSPENPFAKV